MSGHLETIFQLLVADRRQYVQTIARPETAGNPFKIPVVMDYQTPFLDEEPEDALLIFPDIPVERLDAKTLNLIRKAHSEQPFKQPRPEIKRPINGKPEGWGAYYIGGRGGLEVASVSGEVPFPLACSNHGWLLPHLTNLEIGIIGRYAYWRALNEKQALPEKGVIPEIEFLAKPEPVVMEFLHHCLDQISPTWRVNPIEKWRAFDFFVDWLLYSLGHPLVSVYPTDHWDGDVHSRLYQVFDASYLLLFPYDYLGTLLEQFSDSLRTVPPQMPLNRAIELAKDLFPYKGMDYRTQLSVDPETATGRLLMASSNYTLDLLGISTSQIFSKVALINLYLWAPWGIFPLKFLDRALSHAEIQGCLGRALTVLKRKRLPRDYFTIHEPDPIGSPFQPIYLWRKRQSQPATLPGQPLPTFPMLASHSSPEPRIPSLLPDPTTTSLPKLPLDKERPQLPPSL